MGQLLKYVKAVEVGVGVGVASFFQNGKQKGKELDLRPSRIELCRITPDNNIIANSQRRLRPAH